MELHVVREGGLDMGFGLGLDVIWQYDHPAWERYSLDWESEIEEDGGREREKAVDS